MKIEKLLNGVEYKDCNLSDNIEIENLTYDSRKIKKGMMFAAINGENNNGIDFCDKALKAGATTILCSKKEINKIIKKKANILTTKNVSGTNDWKKYTVEIPPIPNYIENITVFLVLNEGTTGTVYFDDFSMYVKK